tara:strand:- start:8 stop:511 length:504 start_codon:yes stop_codon:yes gene_type:complete
MRLGQYFGQWLKKSFFFNNSNLSSLQVLEIGPGYNWASEYINEKNAHYQSLDVVAPADIICDIKDYKSSSIATQKFDVIIAFEIVEHVDCLEEISSLLNSGGFAFVTTPVPHFDWVCNLLEFLHINQKRTSPHSNLIYLRTSLPPSLTIKKYKNLFFLGQWAILEKI